MILTRDPRNRIERTAQLDERLCGLLDLHCHPRHGSLYWRRRQESLGWDVRDRVRSVSDLWLLGPTRPEDLRNLRVKDFIPQVFHSELDQFVVGETAGTSGAPQATAYRADEFETAFVMPFLRVAAATGFPCGEPWLWVGPSGPHIIGKIVRELARQTGSMDPFSVDFDPRWAKRLADGSLARRRYLDHVIEQALNILRREEIAVLFTTPPALTALAQKMTDCQREAIRGVHYGGMSIGPETINHFREAFPYAVHLAGYGNTLFGVVMEVTDRPRQALDYFPLGERVIFEVVAGDDSSVDWPPERFGPGQRGRVLFHRLDESCLLIGVIERDEAERVPAPLAAVALGCTQEGLRDPRPPAALDAQLKLGIY